ncbi:MAG: DUF1585 domain-containing protein [Myxococcota bacterium]|nr:DUF1585 domain-containing protein [Myxococcota bacterium]
MRIALIAIAILTLPTQVFAEPSAPVCSASSAQESLHYLRRLSLDLRGHLPSISEYEFVTSQGSVSAQQIDEMLVSSGFVGQMRRYHRKLLWVNIGNQRLAGNFWQLSNAGRGSPAYWLTAGGRATNYRGARVPCGDFEHYENPDGTYHTEPHPDPDSAAAGVVQEGWRWVQPYWNPDQPVKICAFDAQSALTAANETNRGPPVVDCSTSQAVRSTKCGCGPNLQWCPNRDTVRVIARSLDEQLLRFADSIVRDGLAYSQLLTSRSMEINGPIAHYLRYQTQAPGISYIVTGDQGYSVPQDLTFDQVDEWRTVQRSEMHAGLLTMPSFLTKFQSNRGRANRFFNAFRCESFQAPPGGLPATDDACHQEPNLTKRCGCKYCHVSVEPTAAAWGRWSEAGIKPLIAEADSDAYPAHDPLCAPGGGQAGSSRCRLFYINESYAEDDPRKPYEGYLRAYLFSDHLGEDNGSFAGNIEVGPVALAAGILTPEDGSFARCVSQKMFEHFTGRSFRPLDDPFKASLSSSFQSSFDLRQLIRSIVMSSEYRQAARFGLTQQGDQP